MKLKIRLIVVVFAWLASSLFAPLSKSQAQGGLTLESQLLQQENEIVKLELDILIGKSKFDAAMLARARKASQANLIATSLRADFLQTAGIVYTNYDFHIVDSYWTESSGITVLTVTESISLTIAGWENDSSTPPFTQYEQWRILKFSKSANGELVLESDELPFQFSERSGPPLDLPDTSRQIFLPVVSSQPNHTASSANLNTGFKPNAVQANKYAIVNYALTWALGRNSAYRDFSNNGGDCTNFVSQAMFAGGWSHVPGFYTLDSAWWYNIALQTRTWTEVNAFWRFATAQGRGIQSGYISCYCSPANSNWAGLSAGDVMQADWTADGSWDHNMIITAKDSSGRIFLSYHSTDRKNFPLADFIWAAYTQSGKKVTLRGLRIY